jgi:hypothetical protein
MFGLGDQKSRGSVWLSARLHGSLMAVYLSSYSEVSDSFLSVEKDLALY